MNVDLMARQGKEGGPTYTCKGDVDKEARTNMRREKGWCDKCFLHFVKWKISASIICKEQI